MSTPIPGRFHRKGTSAAAIRRHWNSTKVRQAEIGGKMMKRPPQRRRWGELVREVVGMVGIGKMRHIEPRAADHPCRPFREEFVNERRHKMTKKQQEELEQRKQERQQLEEEQEKQRLQRQQERLKLEQEQAEKQKLRKQEQLKLEQEQAEKQKLRRQKQDQEKA
ncbi:MAG: hypothetical protein HZC39_01440 [Chloroflexi bacterium]|nr:hypothetical protein [Chloroflexota bacterium]MBI5702167.1 hypothetical protein [Chloroflexota bacterium]